MKKELPKIIFVYLIIVALQLTFIEFISIDNIQPQLLVIFVVYYSLRFNDNYSLIFGFSSGLLFDLISGGIMGVGAFSYTIVSFVTNKFRQKIVTNSGFPFYYIWLIFLASAISSFFFNFFYAKNLDTLDSFLLFSIFSALYTTFLFSIILFILPENKINGK